MFPTKNNNKKTYFVDLVTEPVPVGQFKLVDQSGVKYVFCSICGFSMKGEVWKFVPDGKPHNNLSFSMWAISIRKGT